MYILKYIRAMFVNFALIQTYPTNLSVLYSCTLLEKHCNLFDLKVHRRPLYIQNPY